MSEHSSYPFLDILTPGSRVRTDLQVFRQRGMFDRSSNPPVEIAR